MSFYINLIFPKSKKKKGDIIPAENNRNDDNDSREVKEEFNIIRVEDNQGSGNPLPNGTNKKAFPPRVGANGIFF